MPLQIYPTFSSPGGNGQNCYPMLYYAPHNPYQHQQHPQYDPATTSFLAMPSLIPEQHPLYYTLDQHGNYVLLTPQNAHLQLSSDQNGIDIGGELPHLLLSSTQLDSIDSSLSSQPNDPSPSFYDSRNRASLLNASLGAVSRKSGGSGGKSRNSSAYKTMMCNMFSTNGTCSYGSGCQYAHGTEEIRPTIPHPKYKTQLCNKFNSPRGCQYGEKCHFRHPDDHEKNSEESKKSIEDDPMKSDEDEPMKSDQDESKKSIIEDKVKKSIIEDKVKKSIVEDELKKLDQDGSKKFDHGSKKSVEDGSKKSIQDESLLK